MNGTQEATIPGKYWWDTTYMARFDPDQTWPTDINVTLVMNPALRCFDGTALNASQASLSQAYVTGSISLTPGTPTSVEMENITDHSWSSSVPALVNGQWITGYQEVPTTDTIIPFSISPGADFNLIQNAFVVTQAPSTLLQEREKTQRKREERRAHGSGGDNIVMRYKGRKESSSASAASSTLSYNVSLCPGQAVNSEDPNLFSCFLIQILTQIDSDTMATVTLPAGTKYNALSNPLPAAHAFNVMGRYSFTFPFPSAMGDPGYQSYRLWLRHGLQDNSTTTLDALASSIAFKPAVSFTLSRPYLGYIQLDALYAPSTAYLLTVIENDNVVDGLGLTLQYSNKSFTTRPAASYVREASGFAMFENQTFDVDSWVYMAQNLEPLKCEQHKQKLYLNRRNVTATAVTADNLVNILATANNPFLSFVSSDYNVTIPDISENAGMQQYTIDNSALFAKSNVYLRRRVETFTDTKSFGIDKFGKKEVCMPYMSTNQFVQKTDLGVTYIPETNLTAFVWVSSLTEKQNIEGCSVAVFEALFADNGYPYPKDITRQGQGTTDANGTVVLKLPAPHTVANQYLQQEFYLVVNCSGEVVILDGIHYPEFAVNFNSHLQAEIITDRLAYTVPDVIYLKGYIRAGYPLQAPNITSCHLSILMSWGFSGDQTVTTPVQFDAQYGAFNATIAVPTSAVVGAHTIYLEAHGRCGTEVFHDGLLTQETIIVSEVAIPTVVLELETTVPVYYPQLPTSNTLLANASSYIGVPVGGAQISIFWSLIRGAGVSWLNNGGGSTFNGGWSHGIFSISAQSLDIEESGVKLTNEEGEMTVSTDNDGFSWFDLDLPTAQPPIQGDHLIVRGEWIGPTGELVLASLPRLFVSQSSWNLFLRPSNPMPLPGYEFGFFVNITTSTVTTVPNNGTNSTTTTTVGDGADVPVNITLYKWDGLRDLTLDANGALVIGAGLESNQTCSFTMSSPTLEPRFAMINGSLDDESIVGYVPQCRFIMHSVDQYLAVATTVDNNGYAVVSAYPVGRTNSSWGLQPLSSFEGVTLLPSSNDYAIGDDVTYNFNNPFNQSQILIRWGNVFGMQTYLNSSLEIGLNSVSFTIGEECTGGCNVILALVAPRQTQLALPVDLPTSKLFDPLAPASIVHHHIITIVNPESQLLVSVSTNPAIAPPSSNVTVLVKVLDSDSNPLTAGQVCLVVVDKAYLDILPPPAINLGTLFSVDLFSATSYPTLDSRHLLSQGAGYTESVTILAERAGQEPYVAPQWPLRATQDSAVEVDMSANAFFADLYSPITDFPGAYVDSPNTMHDYYTTANYAGYGLRFSASFSYGYLSYGNTYSYSSGYSSSGSSSYSSSSSGYTSSGGDVRDGSAGGFGYSKSYGKGTAQGYSVAGTNKKNEENLSTYSDSGSSYSGYTSYSSYTTGYAASYTPTASDTSSYSTYSTSSYSSSSGYSVSGMWSGTAPITEYYASSHSTQSATTTTGGNGRGYYSYYTTTGTTTQYYTSSGTSFRPYPYHYAPSGGYSTYSTSLVFSSTSSSSFASTFSYTYTYTTSSYGSTYSYSSYSSSGSSSGSSGYSSGGSSSSSSSSSTTSGSNVPNINPNDVRNSFVATPFFLAYQEIDSASGLVNVTFTLPENVGEFQVTAYVADTTFQGFGIGVNDVISRQPDVTIQPIVPLQARVNDTFQVGGTVTLTNSSLVGSTLSLRLIISNSSLNLLSPPTQMFVMNTVGPVQALFNVSAFGVGNATVELGVFLGQEQQQADAFAVFFPIGAQQSYVYVATTVALQGDNATTPTPWPQGIALPATIPNSSNLTVSGFVGRLPVIEALSNQVLIISETQPSAMDLLGWLTPYNVLLNYQTLSNEFLLGQAYATAQLALVDLPLYTDDTLGLMWYPLDPNSNGYPVVDLGLNLFGLYTARRVGGLSNATGGRSAIQVSAQETSQWMRVSVEQLVAMAEYARQHGTRFNDFDLLAQSYMSFGVATNISAPSPYNEDLSLNYLWDNADQLSMEGVSYLAVAYLSAGQNSANVSQLLNYLESNIRSQGQTAYIDMANGVPYADPTASTYGLDAFALSGNSSYGQSELIFMLANFVGQQAANGSVPVSQFQIAPNQAIENLFSLVEYDLSRDNTNPNLEVSFVCGNMTLTSQLFNDENDTPVQQTFNFNQLPGDGSPPELVFYVNGTGEVDIAAGISFLPADINAQPVYNGFYVEKIIQVIDPLTGALTGPAIDAAPAGSQVQVTIQVTNPDDMTSVNIVDLLPGCVQGLPELLYPSISQDTTDTSSPFYWSWWRPFTHKQILSDRVTFFAPYLVAGTHTVSYTALLVTNGTFVVPPTKVFCTLEPQVLGLSAGGTLTTLDMSSSSSYLDGGEWDVDTLEAPIPSLARTLIPLEWLGVAVGVVITLVLVTKLMLRARESKRAHGTRNGWMPLPQQAPAPTRFRTN